MHPLINIATKAARSASKIILQSYDRLDRVKVDEKSKNDFVTEVDKKVEQEIIYQIQKAYPQHSFLSEEMGEIINSPDHQWIIDPLDGTANFIKGLPHFAISIAFKNKGQIEQGVIYDPLRDEMFTASRGEGAKLNNRRIRMNNCHQLERALIGTGFPFRCPHLIDTYFKQLHALYPNISDLRRAGAASLDLAYVAAGRLDGYFEYGLKIWDIAAGVLLIKEAGGFISDMQGGEKYLESGNVVTANPKLFKMLLTQLNGTGLSEKK